MQDNVTQDPEVIYLQPECCVCPDGEGRQWCEDNFVWECEEDSEPTKYVRADLASTTAQTEAVQKLVDALESAADTLHIAASRLNDAGLNVEAADFLDYEHDARAALAAHRESQP